jgi:hypothetical protein
MSRDSDSSEDMESSDQEELPKVNYRKLTARQKAMCNPTKPKSEPMMIQEPIYSRRTNRPLKINTTSEEEALRKLDMINKRKKIMEQQLEEEKV